MSDDTSSSDAGKTDAFGEFLHAKSMLTPGLCGALVMAITNAVGVSFGLEGSSRAAACLVLSLLTGSLVFAGLRGVRAWWLKAVYYVLNSLIIFSTAAGTNFSVQLAKDSPAPSGPAVTNTVIITNTVYHTQMLVQVVSNGRTNVKTGTVTKGPSVLATNRAPLEVKPATHLKTVDKKFFEKWR